MKSNSLGGAAAALRHAFDQSFAAPRETKAQSRVDLLALSVHGNSYVIRLADVASLHAGRLIVSVPSDSPNLLGLAGFRGSMAPVFDLGSLLGYPGAVNPRWFLLLAAAEPIGLAFDLFEAHLHVAAASISTVEVITGAPFVHGLVRAADGVVRSLIHTASLIEAITSRAPTDRARKE